MDVAKKKELLGEAERLAAELGRFRTPSSGEPIDPSRVAEVARYTALAGDLRDVEAFLTQLPGSFHAHMSRSAQPQLLEVARVIRPLLKRVKDLDHLIYVLSWAKRILQTAERGAGPLDAPRRGPPPRGGARR